jgi:hypothetical protein
MRAKVDYRTAGCRGQSFTWLFGEDREIARERYRRFVNDPLSPAQNPWSDLVGEIYLGSEAWGDQMREKIELKPRCDAHPRGQRILQGPSMTEVVTAVAEVIGIGEDRVRTTTTSFAKRSTAVSLHYVEKTANRSSDPVYFTTNAHSTDGCAGFPIRSSASRCTR